MLTVDDEKEITAHLFSGLFLEVLNSWTESRPSTYVYRQRLCPAEKGTEATGIAATELMKHHT